MNVAKKMLSWILTVFLLSSSFSPIVLPAQAAVTETISAESSTTSAVSLPGSDELYDGYLKQLFYADNSVSFLGEAAKNQLGPLGQNLYGFLKENLLDVSSGTSSSTVFSLSAEQISAWGGTISYEKNESQTAQAAAAAALSSFKEEFEVENVISALLHDCPYALYWYDKVTGVTESGNFTLAGSSCSIQSVDFKFAVVTDMQAESYSSASPAFDTSNVEAAAAAASNAQDLVNRFADCTDHAKLLAYKEEICSLVSFDKAAASNGNFSTDADPWQLIYVFDENTTTNVVCEGYSKAFQYLFDLSEFTGSVDCVTVMGEMSDEGHMWNIVTINGLNYLTDITNSDSGTMGADGGLFLAGAAGDISNGYVAKGLTYTYDSGTLALWGSDTGSRLNLAAENYRSCELGHTEVIDPAVEATCIAAGLTEGSHCSVCDAVITAQEVVPTTGVHNYVDTVCPGCGAVGGSCGDHLAWTLVNGVLTVSGTGEMDQYALNDIADTAITEATHPWASYTAVITEIVMEDGVTSIGDYAFANCTALQSIEIPAGITVLGDSGIFFGCTSLDIITFCGNAPSMGAEAFAGMTATAYYPAADPTWTADVLQNHGGSITWKPYCEGNHTIAIDAKVDATCTETGLSEGTHCSACGEILTAQQTIPAAGHDYDATVIVPTCTKAGYTMYVCRTCRNQYTDHNVDALGHDWQDATCTAPKTCSDCGTTNGSALAHSYTDGWDTSCEVCGHIRVPEITPVPMYRLYNPYTLEHLLTADAAERDLLISAGWSLDGVAWNSPTVGEPVYRLYNPYDDWHTYSMNQEEIDMLVPLGWQVDGIVCLSATKEDGKPVYRLFNPYEQKNYHLLTASEDEREMLETLGWKLDGVAWYCLAD